MRNKDYQIRVKKRIDALSKPLDSLGDFETIISRMGAVLKDEEVRLNRPVLLVFCGDNGVIEEGVSQSDEEVTSSVTRMLGLRNTSVCHMAKKAGVEVFPYDIGVKNSRSFEGVDVSFHIKNGTRNFAVQEAMTPDEARAAMEAGRAIVKNHYERGSRIILLGEMGIGNTTTSAAVISALLKLDPRQVCGRGSGISDAGFEKKISVIKSAINKYSLTSADAFEILCAVGGFDIAAMVGAILMASKLSIPVIVDGIITAAAALLAVEIEDSCRDVIFFSHNGREKGIEYCAQALSMKPVINADMALGEGTGGVLFFHLLTCVLEVYYANSTFEEANIEAYTRFV